MKSKKHSALFNVFVIGALIIQSLLLSCNSKGKDIGIKNNYLWVGASSTSINPEIGMYIAGDKPNRRFTGIHDSIFAKVVVLRKEKEILALVTIDCIGLRHCPRVAPFGLLAQ